MESHLGSVVAVGVVALSWFVPAAGPPVPARVPDPPPVATRPPVRLEVRYHSAARGRSGAVRIRQALPGERLELPLEWLESRPAGVAYRWVAVGPVADGDAHLAGTDAPMPLGTDDAAVAPAAPGVYRLVLSVAGQSRRLDDLDLVVQVPFRYKEGGYLKGYLIGMYPTERQSRRDRYAPPEGFIEVTPQNRSLRVSEHFTLGEFLTKDQRNVWPKYVVVDTRLLDKLELVMQELNAQGIRADRMIVMSGFRTPQYNRKGLNQGRASLSRHQYGDAADVWVDNDGDWYMDDLDGDGRRDTRDARVMLRAVERVESKHPDLLGGAGIYRDNGAHGPFIHIDARGRRARW